ncbi:hypothetical protein [Rhizobium sp. Leaf262]|uniref:NACHT domain-containing protein n=1 Tax=Rhizobium sp. Leaf262 TaxID=1736312 RepID=UPI0007163409|nr:hypothetical protein [Rhizobium sp. Leaf262]KQO79006.1 hypothetical protein ASF29_04605 [Rhizobium sp. Leaf262]
MPYFYENLDEDRFQRLAQAVLTTTFPNVQCLPVKQPDGGRDAFFPYYLNGKQEFYVFQVKFSRAPNTKSEREAIEAVIATEGEKVEALKKKGATAYYLITNVAGTAHPDVGSIDRTNVALSAAFGIPSYCWWRDDLDSRIDANGSIKWSYPDIIKASDLIPVLLGGLWGSQSREQALKSYLAIQYANEAEVKFKQVELQNKLLDLFVDVPVAPINQHEDRNFIYSNIRAGVLVAQHEFVEFEEGEIEYAEDDDGPVYIRHGRRSLSASSLLLNSTVDNNCIVLEGAPGQGKSTITQYICQVNRIKLLGKAAEREFVDKAHLAAPTRFPFRVDLRDYAAWLGGRNPFTNESFSPPSISLEAFIAAQVEFLSGGHEFSVADLVTFMKNGHVSVVLDGFDEVADIPTRRKVVEEISKAAIRLQTHQKDIQFMVTSRPAAFANSPGFSYEAWNHFELQSMTQAQIREYSGKWMNARRLPAKEKSEFSKLLNEKLEQPHMRDLARNPMQLAILLALIHTRGLSLPDKRTALYDNYMELFFNREAEKSRVVREHRDLLIDIHRYIAWELHTSAEQGGSDGSVSEAELRAVLVSYLQKEGHDGSLVDRLFVGMIERVVALVSRKQGSYEFEVQPLREYFAARHLYETAPYSPPGKEVGGTKPDRFEILSRNFYWLNTTRFYCGCYSRGELSSLADGLEELSRHGLYELIYHPRNLALMLLGDWVFSQQPLLVKRLIKSLFEPRTLKIVISGAMRGRGEPIALPDKCGRLDLAEGALEALSLKSSEEDRQAILQIYRANTSDQERLEWWLKQVNGAGFDLKGWLEDGRLLALLGTVSHEKIREYLDGNEAVAVSSLLEVNRLDILHSSDVWLDASISLIISGHFMSGLQPFHRSPPSDLSYLQGLISPYLFHKVFSEHKQADIIQSLSRSYGISIAKLSSDGLSRSSKLLTLRKTIEVAVELLVNNKKSWSSELLPWQQYVDNFRQFLGNSWALRTLCVISAGIRSTTELGAWSDQAWVFDERFCERIRFARLKAGNIQWWKAQFEQISADVEERRTMLLTFVAWASPKTMLALASEISSVLDDMSDEDWSLLLKAFRQVNAITGKTKSVIAGTLPIPTDLVSTRYLAVLNIRGSDEYKSEIYLKFGRSYSGKEASVLTAFATTALKLARDAKIDWDEALSQARKAYGEGAQLFEHVLDPIDPPLSAAKQICTDACSYPQFIVRRAQGVLAAQAGVETVKLKDASEDGHWFDEWLPSFEM